MYGIEINGVKVEFDGTISIIENNPVLSDELSYSLQFSCSAESEVNRIAHNYIDRPEISLNQEKEFSCVITAGVKQLIGTVVSKYQNGSFTDYFKLSGSFWNLIKDKSLSEIPFDKVIFSPKNYAEIETLIDEYNLESLTQPFSFPLVINYRTGAKMPVKIDFFPLVNTTLENAPAWQYAIIPFVHLSYVLKSICEKFGIQLQENAFDNYVFLKRLILANNYLINEFYLNKNFESEAEMIIASVESGKDPVVTTVSPHGLYNNQLCMIVNATELLSNRIFQIEVVDNVKFKILGEETVTACTLQYHITDAVQEYDNINQYILTLDAEIYKIDDFIHDWAHFKLTSNYDSDYYILQRVYENGVLQKNKIRFYGNAQEADRSEEFINGTLYYIAPMSVPLGVGETTPSTYVGVLQKLPPLDCAFTRIDPAKHMPDLKISDFIVELEKLGIYFFVNNSSADIYLIKDILNSSDFIDISTFTSEIVNNENVGLKGYSLKMTVDGSDDYAKKMLPVTLIDDKYTVKDPVNTFADLEYNGSETNDVRLVINENAYYVFNKSFLNADNNWKFFCYNLLDKIEGEKELQVNTRFAPTVPSTLSIPNKYAQLDVACNSQTFFDSTLKTSLRLLSYYIQNNKPIAVPDLYDNEENEIPGAELAIRWDGPKGIYNVMLKEYIEWQLNIRKDCTAIIHWPAQLTTSFKFNKKYRIKGVDYLVKSIRYTIDFRNKRIVFNETELAKV